MINLYIGTDLRDDFTREVLTPAERWAAIGLRLLIADCPYRPVLCIAPGYPMIDAEIARQISVPVTLWRRTKHKLLRAGKIEIDPKVGIRYADWRSSNPRDNHLLRVASDSSSLLPLSEQELQEDRDNRTKVMDLFNLITGSVFDPDMPQFVRCFRDRVAEGATMQEILLVVRRACWAAMNADPAAQKYIQPRRVVAAESFWKWVKKDTAQEATGRMVSTLEYIKGLPPGEPKRRAMQLVSQYTQENKLIKRKNGWDTVVDTDFRKIMTCKEYVMLLMETPR